MVSFSYEYVISADKLGAVANEINEASVIALDLETTGFSPFDSKIRLLSVNTGQNVYVIDAFQTKTLEPVISALRKSKCVKVLQNAKFDQKFLLHYQDLELWPLFDTYRASALIYNGKHTGRGAHDLWALFSRELNRAPETQDLGGSDWSNPLLTVEQLDYAAEDVVWLPKLREVLRAKLVEEGLGKVALIEFGAILPEAAMELNGFDFDKEKWLALAAENEKQQSILYKELVTQLPHPSKQLSLLGFDPDFNLDSPAQLLKSLQLLGLQIESTNETTLAMFASEYPIISRILDYKGYAHAVKNFGREYLQYVNPITNRIHTSYYPFTGAGRYSSSKPNCQQLPRAATPKRKPYEYRECFIAPSGYKLVIKDYSQIELRAAAEIANDQTLLGVYQRGEDAHSLTASLVTGVPLAEVTKSQRQLAKAVNFGLCIAEGQQVLTDSGLVPIEQITLDHRLWDGLEWVNHGGLLDKGEKEVIEHSGLVATPDHIVYTDLGWKIPLELAAQTSIFGNIAIGAIEGRPVEYSLEPQSLPFPSPFTPTKVKTTARVYDIYNAGPRHRFTVGGKVVSNCFGMAAPKLVIYAQTNYGVTMSLTEAIRFREKYFQAYAGIKKWHREIFSDSHRARGISYTPAGRLRYLSVESYNEFSNTPVQGGCADGLKAALRILYFKLKKYHGQAAMVHMVHDEVITRAKDDPELLDLVEEDLSSSMIEGMEQIFKKVPIVVEGGRGDSWLEK